MNIDDVIHSDKRFACTILLKPSFLKIFEDNSKIIEMNFTTTEDEIVKSIERKVVEENKRLITIN